MCVATRSNSLISLPVSPTKQPVISSKIGENPIKPSTKITPKDSKDIASDLSKTPKSPQPAQFNFVDKKYHSLTDKKIMGVTAKVITSEVGKILTEKAVTKAVSKVVEKSITAFGGKIVKSIAKNTIETAIMSIGEEVTLKAIQKGAVKATEKGSTELSKRLAGAVPVVGAAIELGFTIYDAKYAYDLTKDKNVSKISKALAWGTVGLDLVSTVCTATGVGTPIAWAATGLSVVTAVASDMLQ